ncbi:MAG: ketopantoate reductase C-terminal domain-containing protein [Bacteroidales bacterium]
MRVAGCTGRGQPCTGRGCVDHFQHEFVLGYPDQDPDTRINELASILESVVPVRVTSRLMNELYSKLIVNSCITSLGALTGLMLGEMLARKKARILFLEIIREAMEVAYIMKIDVPPYGGKLDYYKLIAYSGFRGRIKQHLTLRAIGMKYRRLKSSSLQSLERGKMTEIDYLNGFIASNGTEFGVPVNVNRTIVEMVHEIELGKRKITVSNLDDERFTKYYHK